MRRTLIALFAGISALAAGGVAFAQEASESDPATAEQTRQMMESSGNLASAKVDRAMQPRELGDTTSETSPGVDIDGELKKGVQDPIGDAGDQTIAAADFALKSKGYEGGLAGQGIDTSQIKGATTFDGILPQVASSMVKDVLASTTAALK